MAELWSWGYDSTESLKLCISMAEARGSLREVPYRGLQVRRHPALRQYTMTTKHKDEGHGFHFLLIPDESRPQKLFQQSSFKNLEIIISL